MKKIYPLLIFALLLLIKNGNAQWTILPSGNFSELRSAYFLNSKTGFVVGSDSAVLKTTDGANNWTSIPSGTTDTLRCVYFTDDTTGYTVGAQGTIMKTTNGGNTWTQQVSGNTALLRSVHFPTHETGYIAGGNGTILKTTDGGANWIPQVSGTVQDLISTRFINADTGFVVSSLATFFSGLILKTTDGGNTWDTVHVDANGFLSVFPANKDTIYAVGGSGAIVKSTDGGASWFQLTSGITTNLRATFFLTPDTGFAAGDSGKVLFTGDGGVTWINQSIQSTGLLGLYFPMHDTGYAVGTAGIILRYSKPCALPAEPGQIFGGTTVCQGDSMEYYIHPVANATGYTWTGPPGSTVISGQGDTLVTILLGSASGIATVTADNDCGQGLPHNLLINVHALPAIPTISANGNMLVSSPANSYQWYFNGNSIAGATAAVYIPLQNGSYSVVVTNAFGCAASSVSFNVVNAGISAQTATGLSISPMPFHDYFEISWNRELASMAWKNLVIFNITGSVLKEINVSAIAKSIVETADLSPGMYFYRITTIDKVAYFGKLIKR